MTILRLTKLAFVLLLLAHAPLVAAADFYVEPESGLDAGDGSQANPWRTVQAVVSAGLLGTTVAAGDTLWLGAGDHGELVINNVHGSSTAAAITIAAAPDTEPLVSRVQVSNSTFLVIAGLHVTTEHLANPQKGTFVSVQAPSADVVVDGCHVQTVADTSGWSAQDWVDRAGNGITVDGTRITVSNNIVRNIDFGISVTATDSSIHHNTVDGFSGDGMRGLGDYTTFEYNTVMNCYDVDDNHDDGFQSWSLGPGGVGTGEVVGIVLRGNTFINTTDQTRPLNGAMQGIGCFDGTFRDWVVENNVIATNHWHGITLLGVVNSRVVNNTVMDINDTSPGPPWISVEAHKNGTAPTGCVVANNLTTALSNHADVTEAGNLLLKDVATDLTTLFVDPAAYDLRLLAGSAPIDAADTSSPDFTALIDADGTARPQGSGVDVGAFEWHEAVAVPEDAESGPEQVESTPDSAAAEDVGAEDIAVADSGPEPASELPADVAGDSSPTDVGSDAAQDLVADPATAAPKPGDTSGCTSSSPKTPAPWALAAVICLLFGMSSRRRRDPQRA